MQFEPPLRPATLIRRYKRFLADIILEDGSEVTAHVANPGAMTGLKDEGRRIWVQPATNPARKLKYSWIMVDLGNETMTGVDTSLPNKIVGEALRSGEVNALAAYSEIIAEQKYGENSRIDFLLRENGLPDAYVEVKSVTFSRTQKLAEFPDSATERGTKHLRELAQVAKAGQRAVMFYLIQRNDCSSFEIAADIDAAYSDAFKDARKAGVEVLVYDCELKPSHINLGQPIAYG